MASPPSTAGAAPRPWYRPTLTRQILFGLVVGCGLGWWMSRLPAGTKVGWDEWMSLIRDIFLHLIKAMIAPLVFASIVQGIAGTSDSSWDGFTQDAS